MVITTLLLSFAFAAAAKEPPKTVFFGDSITEGWRDDIVFDKNTINYGISGQTTTQMRERFQKHVIDEKPATVHLLMGTNDIAGNGGPYNFSKTKENIEWMVKTAKGKNIKIIIGSVLPASTFHWSFTEKDPTARIKELNRWIKEFAAKEDLVYVDYFQAMSTENGAMKKELAEDGVHPNKEGYAVMQPLVLRALRTQTAARSPDR